MLVGLFIAAPRIAITQVSPAVRRIGFLYATAPLTPEQVLEAAAPLRELGWVEGRNLHVERRYANGQLEALVPLAEELVRANVEVIVAEGPNPTRAAMRATTTIPIVGGAGDVLLSGIAGSFAAPSGNVTGVSLYFPEVVAKIFSLLREVLPTVQRVGMLEVSGNPQYRLMRDWLARTSRSSGIELIYVQVAEARDIDEAIAQMARQRVQALMFLADSFGIAHRVEIINAALKRGLPTLTSSRFAQDGALITYSYSYGELDRLFAYYVDRILRGARPADLPVQQPMRFTLMINLKTARTVNLTIPASLLLQADEVIR